MRVAHLADTHLGYAGSLIQPNVADPFASGARVSARAAEILIAFDTLVTRLLEAPVDAVLHCGDLFDTPRPSPAIQQFAMRELSRLTNAGMPVFIVEGHHSYPRQLAIG